MAKEDIIIQKGLNIHWNLIEYKSTEDIILIQSLEKDLAKADINLGVYA